MKKTNKERRAFLESIWDSVSDEMEKRWNSIESQYTFVPHMFMVQQKEEIGFAYSVVTALANGLPPATLNTSVYDTTLERVIIVAGDADALIGPSSSDGNEVRLTRLETAQSIITRNLRFRDMPRNEIPLLGEYGIDLSPQELKQIIRSIRAKSKLSDEKVHPYQGTFSEARMMLREEMNSPKDTIANRHWPTRKFFTGVRKVLVGAVSVIADVSAACTWNESGAIASIACGIDYGFDGVENMRKDYRLRHQRSGEK